MSDEVMYVIWSNQKRMWWRPDGQGYTEWLELAGRYDYRDATDIVNDATVSGELTYPRTDPHTGGTFLVLDEWMLIAPEHRRHIRKTRTET
jgi:hypothetical protein